MSKAQPVVKEPNGLVRFYRETIGELRKVVWPTWPEARNLTLIVLLVITLVVPLRAPCYGFGGKQSQMMVSLAG